MFITIGIILLILWLIGFLGFHVVAWYVHVLLVLAIIAFLVRIIQGRSPLA